MSYRKDSEDLFKRALRAILHARKLGEQTRALIEKQAREMKRLKGNLEHPTRDVENPPRKKKSKKKKKSVGKKGGTKPI